MTAALRALITIPVVFGNGGICVGEPTTMSTDRQPALAAASHFETPNHLMLRRSPSAHRGVMKCRSHPFDGKRGKLR